jgi:hypothetical protein
MDACSRLTACALQVDSYLSHRPNCNHRPRETVAGRRFAIGTTVIVRRDVFVWSAVGASAWQFVDGRNIAEHYHCERNHQGIGNELIEAMTTVNVGDSPIRRRQRLGGLRNYYARAA